MSSSKQITDCFKMKKPRASPDKCATSVLTTPKRYTKKSKLTPNKRGLSTPGRKEATASGGDGSPYSLERDFYEPADDLMCSQDVVSADVVWDCSYSASGIVKARRNGESDVKSLVKGFRTKPLEPVKPSTSVLNIIGTRYRTTQEAKCSGSRTSPMAPSREQKKLLKTMSAEVIMKEMEKLLDIMRQPKQGRTAENAAVSGASAPTNVDERTVVVEEHSKSCSCDEDRWDVDDDSLLVAATQEMETAALTKTPQRVAASPKAVPATSCLASADFVSPLRCHFRGSPKERIGMLRKSPRLRLLSLNRTPSPLRQRSVVPVATITAETTVDAATTVESPRQRLDSTGSDPLFDDNEDEILDRICSTYEEQQEVDRKMAASAVEAASSLALKFTTSNLVENNASPRTRSRSAACVTKATGTSPNGIRPTNSEKPNPLLTEDRANQVPHGEAAPAAVSGPSASCTRAPFVNRPANFVVPRGQVSHASKLSTNHVGAQFSVLNHKTGRSCSTSNRNATVSSMVPSRPESRSVHRPMVRPFSSLASTSSATKVMTAPSKVHRATKSPVRVQQGSKVKILTLAKPAEPVPDFDDDDTDLATPEVMSWLEKVESQRSTSQKCTPEEIARKREEALRRRKLKEAQEKHQRKARIRPAR